MLPDGVRILAQTTNERQAQFIAKQFDVDQLSIEDVTWWLGEEPTVIRVRKTPTYWQVESWDRCALLQSEDSVAFP